MVLLRGALPMHRADVACGPVGRAGEMPARASLLLPVRQGQLLVEDMFSCGCPGAAGPVRP
jgi:hypothetical protein